MKTNYSDLQTVAGDQLLKATFLAMQGLDFIGLMPFYDRILPVEKWSSEDRRESAGMFIYKLNEHVGILCYSSGYRRSNGFGDLVLKTGEKSFVFSPVGHLHNWDDNDDEATRNLAKKVIQTCKAFGIATLYKYGGDFNCQLHWVCPELTMKSDYGDLKDLCNAECEVTYPQKGMVPYICCES